MRAIPHRGLRLALLALTLIGATHLASAPAWSQTVWQQRGDEFAGPTTNQWAGRAVATSADGTVVAVGYPGSNISGFKGAVRVFAWQHGAWQQRGSTLDGTQDYGKFGAAVALSADGSMIAVGEPGFGTAVGRVTVHRWNGTSWAPVGSPIDGEADWDEFGDAVALSADGTALAIGAPGNDAGSPASQRGHVRLYGYNGSAWVKHGPDIDGAANDEYLGSAVALSDDGTRIAIGIPGYDAPSQIFNGAAVVYEWNGSTLNPVGSLIVGAYFSSSGGAVAISGDGTTLAVGAVWADAGGISSAGTVTVRRWDGSTWAQRGSPIGGAAEYDEFGSAIGLSVDGSTLAVGAQNADTGDMIDNGTITAFAYDAATSQWTQRGQPMSGAMTSEQLGSAAALSADGATIIGGGWDSDVNGSDSGVARVYVALRPPAAPTAAMAVAGDASATVTWAPPTDDGGSPIAGYTVVAAPGDASCTTTTTTCTVTGLANGTRYTFTVTATNAVGPGTPSDPTIGVVPAATPATAEALAASTTGARAGATVRFRSARGIGGDVAVAGIRVSEAGRLTVTGTDARGAVVCRTAQRAFGAGLVLVRCPLTVRARTAVARAGALRVRLLARFTPTSGSAVQAARWTTVRAVPAAPSVVTG